MRLHLTRVCVLQLPNGEMTAEQMRYAASCIRPYGEDGCADITTRANLQLRGVKLEDAGAHGTLGVRKHNIIAQDCCVPAMAPCNRTLAVCLPNTDFDRL